MDTNQVVTNKLRSDAAKIITDSIQSVLPYDSVRNVLSQREFDEPVTLFAIGKAAWTMASAAVKELGDKLSGGVVLTKYGHSQGPLSQLEIIEAGHPAPDGNSVRGTRRIIEVATALSQSDEVLLLLSGGGSSLFESPVDGVMLEDVIDITNQLLCRGADIVEINTVRKRFSAVKGGRFARICAPATIFAVVLSDVIGNRLDSIASGPVTADMSTSDQALAVIKKYNVHIGDELLPVLQTETPKQIDNCEAVIAGSVDQLCESAASVAERLGYRPLVLTSYLQCEAREAGRYMASLAKEALKPDSKPYGIEPPCVLIAGGETVVRVTGKGKGGRNQELALSAAIEIAQLHNAVIGSVGSDGTDGPTDAAGGIVDGGSVARIAAGGMEPEVYLDNNDSYHALEKSNDLVVTGPTGTNVNDLVFVLCGPAGKQTGIAERQK